MIGEILAWLRLRRKKIILVPQTRPIKIAMPRRCTADTNPNNYFMDLILNSAQSWEHLGGASLMICLFGMLCDRTAAIEAHRPGPSLSSAR